MPDDAPDPRYTSPVASLEGEELGALMRTAMRNVQAILPGNVGITILVFDFGAPGDHEHGLGYISNANRDDMVRSMLEFIAKQLGMDVEIIESRAASAVPAPDLTVADLADTREAYFALRREVQWFLMGKTSRDRLATFVEDSPDV